MLLTKDTWVELLENAGFSNSIYRYEDGVGIFLVEKLTG